MTKPQKKKNAVIASGAKQSRDCRVDLQSPRNDDCEFPLLDRVCIPADMNTLSDEQLKQLSDEVRQEMVEAVAKTGGHLGAGLGVVELTVALQRMNTVPPPA